MRPLRALLHLVLALALTTATVAQASPIDGPAVAASQHHEHVTTAAGGEHAMHGRGLPANGPPMHGRDGCQTACCFMVGDLGVRASEVSAVAFFCDVRYRVTAQPVSGRVDAPEPGVPKHAA